MIGSVEYVAGWGSTDGMDAVWLGRGLMVCALAYRTYHGETFSSHRRCPAGSWRGEIGNGRFGGARHWHTQAGAGPVTPCAGVTTKARIKPAFGKLVFRPCLGEKPAEQVKVV
jgi:hypothetical protein